MSPMQLGDARGGEQRQQAANGRITIRFRGDTMMGAKQRLCNKSGEPARIGDTVMLTSSPPAFR